METTIESQIIIYAQAPDLINFQTTIIQALEPLPITDEHHEIKQALNWNKILKIDQDVTINIWSPKGVDQAFKIDQDWQSLTFNFVSFNQRLDLTILQTIVKTFNLSHLWMHTWDDQYNLKTDLSDLNLTTIYVDWQQNYQQSSKYENHSSAYEHFAKLKANHRLAILNQVKPDLLTKTQAKTR